MKKRIAIIGAGVSGLVCAQKLKNHAEVVLYEKARGVGGRMSTRYDDPFYFDHGTQCFTARSKEFQEFLNPLIEDGVIAKWIGNVVNLEIGKRITKRLWSEHHLVATPNMNSLCKKLSEGLDIRLKVEVSPLKQKQSRKWLLHDNEGNKLGKYDWVISTAPPAQTINLFSIALPKNTAIHKASMQGCYAIMIGFNKPWNKDWIAAKVHNNPIKWISINSTKPGRNNNITAIVVHSRNDWAEKHMDEDINEVQKFLIQQFESVTGISTIDAVTISTHRWKYAIVKNTQNTGFYIDSKQFVAANSDWAYTSRIEEVWFNANKLANNLLHYLLDASD